MIDVTGIGSWAQVDLNGEFDLANSDTICSVVADLVGHGATDLSVELGHVSFMGAAGLNALQAVHKLVEAAGRRMVIIGAAPFLRRLFVISALDQILPLADLPSTTDVPPSGRTTRPVVYGHPDHACPPGQARVSPQRHSVNVSRSPRTFAKRPTPPCNTFPDVRPPASACSPTGNLAPRPSATPWPSRLTWPNTPRTRVPASTRPAPRVWCESISSVLRSASVVSLPEPRIWGYKPSCRYPPR